MNCYSKETLLDATEPKVSIIVPVYNVKRDLRQCLDSICAQSLREIEVICIDDGSTDGSGEILDTYASDSRFIVVHKENEGYGKGINVGLDRARGSYIGIVESDDYIDPNMFRLLYEAACRNDAPDVVKAAFWSVYNSGTDEERIVPANYLHHVEKVDEPFLLKDDAEFLFHHPSIWSAIYRRAFLEEKNIRMMEVPGAGWVDNPFFISTLIEASSIVYIDEPLYYYREANQGSSSGIKDPSVIYSRWFDMDEILKKHRVSDPKILEGHYCRGCSYIEMLDQECDADDPKIKDNIKKMVDLIDYNAVVTSDKIIEPWKNALWRHVSVLKRLRYRVARMLGSR